MALIFIVTVVAMIMAVPLGASAADHTNTQCLGCHKTDVVFYADFTTPAANKANCVKCHLNSLAGAHPVHNGGGNCGSICHSGYPASIGSAIPSVVTTYGSFASVNSPNMSAETIHLAHTNPRWLNVSTTNSTCRSCHGVAACYTCHSSAPLDNHAHHGDPAYGFTATSTVVPEWTGDLSIGVVSSQAEDTYLFGQTLRCGGSRCHDIVGATTGDQPTDADPFLVGAAYQKNPAFTFGVGWMTTTYGEGQGYDWRWAKNTKFSGGTEWISNNNSEAYLRYTFTGDRVSVIADRDPWRGIVEIGIAGVSTTTVDCYSATTQFQQDIWASPSLGAGSHTITIRPTGTKNAASRGKWVGLDKLMVRATSVDVLGRYCGDCHPSEVPDAHGGETYTFPHDASPTVSATNTVKAGSSAFTTGTTAVYGTYTCTSCHKPLLRDEHVRTTNSATRYGTTCDACHYKGGYAPTVWTNTYYVGSNACSYGGCHPSTASTRTAHAYYSSVHTTVTPVVAESAACQSCHYGTIFQTHNNTITAGTTSNCNSCHNATTTATTKDCADAGCHTVTGHTLLTAGGHGFNTTRHTPSNFTRAYQTTTTLDDGGKECNLCHAAALDASHSSPGTSTAVSCSSGGAGGKGCHLDTSLNTMAMAKTTWAAGAYSTSGWASSKRCTDCHNYSGRRSHNTTLTPHLVASNGCAGTPGCHNSNDLWQLHKYKQDLSTLVTDTARSCVVLGCHDAANINKRPTVNAANSCGNTSTGCHLSYSTSHVGAYQHGFTAASQYSSVTESGCTNQTGCHNQGLTSTSDFAAVFHPSSGCTGGTCHAPANPSFDAFNAANTLPDECVDCHATAAAYSGAAARSKLTSSLANGGHYSETTHTASATSSTTALSYNGGGASATCGDCHNYGGGIMAQHQNVNTGVAGSPYGNSIGCGECHGDTRSNGNAQVVANWTSRTCTACHTTGSAPAVHASGTVPAVTEVGSTCGSTGLNCHASPDLHEIHKNSLLGCGLTGCHSYSQQAFVPTIKGCGVGYGCHSTYTSTTHKHAADAAKHQPTASTQASATTYQGVQCGVCHDIRTAQSSLTSEHALATSVGNATVCATCHNNSASTTAVTNNWSAKDTTTACSVCHASGSMAIHADASATAHTVTNTGCGNTGIGCHPTNDFSSVGATATAANTVIHRSCVRCHDRVGAASWTSAMIDASSTLKYVPAVKSCGQASGCHTSTYYSNTTYQHRIGLSGAVTGTDTAKHTADAANMASILQSGTAQATCATCHSSGLSLAHKVTSTTAQLTSGHTAWTNACTGCHNENRAPTANAATQVKGHWTNNRCIDCHTTYHDVLNTNHIGTSTQGCSTAGAGCHTSDDLRVLHNTRADGCNLSGCHDGIDKAMGSAAKSCGSGGTCHNTYTATSHGTVTTGNEVATHETTSTGYDVDTTGGTYTAAGNTCATCHSRGLATAHKDTSTTSALRSVNPAWNSTPKSSCQDCHNTTTPDDVPTVVTANWNLKTCAQCHGATQGTNYHNDYATAHSISSFGSCAVGTCHGASGGVIDARAIHNRSTAGCGVKGASGECHQLDKQMPQSGMSCGSGAATGLACHTAAKYVSGGHGGSNGGINCNTSTCHDQNQFISMVASTGAFHHVLDDASPYAGPAAGAYSTSKVNLQCVSCHVDHNYFNSNKGANLRTTINNASVTATNTDFGATLTDGGICTSCHSTPQTKSTTQKALTSASSKTPTISVSLYSGTAHDYSVVTTFGTQVFKANCSKCHDDEYDSDSKMGGTYKIGLHSSNEDRLIRSLGATLTGTSTEVGENLCYRCHSQDGTHPIGYDGYGSQPMTTSAQNVQIAFNKTYRHAVATSTAAGKHKSDEFDAAPASITGQGVSVVGWWGTGATGRHGECEDCHNVHQAKAGRTAWPLNGSERGSLLPVVSPAVEGVWGVNITGPTNSALANGNWAGSGSLGNPKFPTYSKIQTSTYEWQLCLKCHSRYAWGNVATPTASTGDYTGAAATLTDVGKDFDPANYAVHPLFRTGKNQPPTNANAEWEGASAPRNINGVTTGNGLSNTFVDGWLSTSRVTCADCHGNDSWGTSGTVGPHGSSQRWILRGANPNIKITQKSGTVLTNSGISGYTAVGFCTNCHRADVYGFGNGDKGGNAAMSRAHGGTNASCNAYSKVLPKAINGCFNCHGGRVDAGQQANGAMHGSSMGYGPDSTPKTVAPLPAPMGYRFMNGASWIQHGLGDTDANVGCQTLGSADSYSACVKHNSTSATKWGTPGGTAYQYARPTN